MPYWVEFHNYDTGDTVALDAKKIGKVTEFGQKGTRIKFKDGGEDIIVKESCLDAYQAMRDAGVEL